MNGMLLDASNLSIPRFKEMDEGEQHMGMSRINDGNGSTLGYPLPSLVQKNELTFSK